MKNKLLNQNNTGMALQELMYVILVLIAIFFIILIFVKTGRIFK